MTNDWCRALGIEPPTLEAVAHHREANTFALLLVAQLVRRRSAARSSRSPSSARPANDWNLLLPRRGLEPLHPCGAADFECVTARLNHPILQAFSWC